MSQGVYHVFNVAKMRIMEAVYGQYPKSVSVKEIAKVTGMEQNKVSRLLSHYHYHNYRYFRRMKKKDIDGSYRYKITKKRVKTYFSFVLRIKQGYDLNLNRPTPVKMETYKGLKKAKIKSEKDLILSPAEIAPYVKVSYRGKHELNIKKENALKIVGIIKDEPIKTLVKESEVLEVPEKPDAPEKPVLLPSKIYTSSNGETLPSEEMAELIEFGINKINKQLQSVTNVKEIKKLKDKKRVLLVTVYYNPDIKQFMK